MKKIINNKSFSVFLILALGASIILGLFIVLNNKTNDFSANHNNTDNWKLYQSEDEDSLIRLAVKYPVDWRLNTCRKIIFSNKERRNGELPALAISYSYNEYFDINFKKQLTNWLNAYQGKKDLRQVRIGNYVGYEIVGPESASIKNIFLRRQGRVFRFEINKMNLTEVNKILATMKFFEVLNKSSDRYQDCGDYKNEKYGLAFKCPKETRVWDEGPNKDEQRIINGEEKCSDSFPLLSTLTFGNIRSQDSAYREPKMQVKIIDAKNLTAVTGDYEWVNNICGQGNIVNSELKTVLAGYKTLVLQTTSIYAPPVAPPPRITYYCVNYPKNPLIISFDQSDAEKMEKIIATLKLIDIK